MHSENKIILAVCKNANYIKKTSYMSLWITKEKYVTKKYHKSNLNLQTDVT